jgi:hypothetical protein
VTRRLCLGPPGATRCPAGRLALPGKPRCAEHQRQADLVKAAKRPTMRSYAETKRRADAVAAHAAVHGWLCLGDQDHQPHPTRDLTADHVPAVAAGGSECGPLQVRCRPANSRRGARA